MCDLIFSIAGFLTWLVGAGYLINKNKLLMVPWLWFGWVPIFFALFFIYQNVGCKLPLSLGRDSIDNCETEFDKSGANTTCDYRTH